MFFAMWVPFGAPFGRPLGSKNVHMVVFFSQPAGNKLRFLEGRPAAGSQGRRVNLFLACQKSITLPPKMNSTLPGALLISTCKNPKDSEGSIGGCRD